MAFFHQHKNELTLDIPNCEEIGGVTYYFIKVTVCLCSWTVRHRYSDFYHLNKVLVSDHGVSKDILPPKRVLKNRNPKFVEYRRKSLEEYLRTVYNYLKLSLPQRLVRFLDMHEYDIFYVTQCLANKCLMDIAKTLEPNTRYTLNVLQLHALTESIKHPHPEEEMPDFRSDISHIMDVFSQLTHIKVIGIPRNYKHSNIVPNSLPFSMAPFKALENLELVSTQLERMCYVGTLRRTLKKIGVHYTQTTSVAQVLMCDVLHKNALSDNEIWHKIEHLDLSYNSLTSIDDTIKLVPFVHTLDFTHNKITEIPDLTCLTNLSRLNLAYNKITVCDNLHTKLGNLEFLDLSQNSITSLKGFEKLYSLENLDVSSNQITDVRQARHIGKLPNLECLRLTGNPVAIVVDYRIRILEYFGKRTSHVFLDNEKASPKEVDTANILTAIRAARESIPTGVN